MSEGEASGQISPFTPEQLNWIDRHIVACSNCHHLDNQDDCTTTSAIAGSIVTVASMPGEPVNRPTGVGAGGSSICLRGRQSAGLACPIGPGVRHKSSC